VCTELVCVCIIDLNGVWGLVEYFGVGGGGGRTKNVG